MTKSLPKVKEVIYTDESGLEEKKVKIPKMPLGRYVQFFEELKAIPQTVGGIAKAVLGERPTEEQLPDSADDEDPVVELFLQMPEILAKHWNDLIKLLSIASNIDEEEIRGMDIDEAAQVVLAVIEVNNFFGIKNRYQVMMLEKRMEAVKKKQQRMTVPDKKKK